METKMVKAFGTEALKVPLHAMNIKRREMQPHDVEMEIHFCGICHSDLHQIKNDFGLTMFPIVPGHEIVGHIAAVGAHVTKFQVGDLSAVGCALLIRAANANTARMIWNSSVMKLSLSRSIA